MPGRNLRKRKVPPSSPVLKTRKNPKRKAKRKRELGVCEINGATNCHSERQVELVKFDGCACKRMCMPCARAWLKNSSTCPFCRAPVALVNNIDVEYKRQREDHDVELPAFTFPYTDWLGQTQMFHAHIETSRLFANKRAQFKLPKEILFVVKTIEDIHADVVNDSAYYTLAVNKLFHFRGKRKQALYRVLFYFTMYERNPVAFFFLMTLLRRMLHNKTPRTIFDIEDDAPLQISKGIFHDVPEEPLFTASALDIYKRNTETHYWHLLLHPLCLLYPHLSLELRIGIIDAPSDTDEDDLENFLDFLSRPEDARPPTVAVLVATPEPEPEPEPELEPEPEPPLLTARV